MCSEAVVFATSSTYDAKVFWNITLTTNTPDAEHIYVKAGFEKISSKYYLNLGTTDI